MTHKLELQNPIIAGMDGKGLLLMVKLQHSSL